MKRDNRTKGRREKAADESANKKQNRMGIKTKMVIGFAIPLFCTILIGAVAYSLAASGMTYNYEESMSRALSMAMEYLDFGFESAVSESEQLYYNTDLMRWATGAIYNDWTKQEIRDEVKLDLSVKCSGNSFVDNMYIIPQEGLRVISAYGDDAQTQGFYDALLESGEAECLQTLKGDWIGSHEYIDGVFAQAYDGYSTDSYACSYVRPMATKRACIVIDYSSEAIADILRSLNLGENSVSAFVTADGREILLENGELVRGGDFSFVNQPYYTEAMADTVAIVIDYVTYKNAQYLFMISKSGSNGSAICAMVPVSMVNAGAASIRNVTILLVIVSWLIALFAGVLIIRGIVLTISHLSRRLQVVAGGDLTVQINTSRRDEFKILVKSIAEMIRNSRNLIIQVLNTTKDVSDSTEKLANATVTLNNSNSLIADSVEEMDKGLNSQSENSRNCLELMDELSGRITAAVESAEHINAIMQGTRETIENGMATMDDLAEKSTDTSDITRQVTTNISNLGESLKEIEKFVETINKIAKETNLLALNASIEAARAGEAGKGFAVVALSVSDLSDNTIQAADMIRGAMATIRRNADDTVNASMQAGDIVSRQAQTVQDTIRVFRGLNDDMENIIAELSALSEAIRSMEQHRKDTLMAIEGISSVSEENAAAVSAVNDSLKKQMEIVDNLHDSMRELEDKAETLNEAVNAFRL